MNKFKEMEEAQPGLHLEDLPEELHKIILSYLPVNQITKTIQLLSRYWRNIVLERSFWHVINLNQPLNISQRLRKVQLLAERRSKGKQFKAYNRITGEQCTVRKIYLDVTNAGQDDGLPTSVLRELSYLKSINHPNVIQ